MSHKPHINFEFVFNGSLLVFSVYVLWASVRMGLGHMREPEAGFFPFLTGLLIFITSIIPMVTRQPEARYGSFFKSSREARIFLVAFLISILWILLIDFIGYAIITFLVAFSYCKVMGLEGWGKPLLLSLAISIFMYILFDLWLYTDLPRGFLG